MYFRQKIEGNDKTMLLGNKLIKSYEPKKKIMKSFGGRHSASPIEEKEDEASQNNLFCQDNTYHKFPSVENKINRVDNNKNAESGTRPQEHVDSQVVNASNSKI